MSFLAKKKCRTQGHRQILICLIVYLFFSLEQGKIVVQKPLDREIIPNYTLRITATDNGNPPRYGETSVSDVSFHSRSL